MLKQVGFLNYIRNDWLDATVSFYIKSCELESVKNELNSLIEPECPKNEARRKTIDVLTRTWIRIPTELESLQQQALTFYDEIAPRHRLILHWGMLLATFPFFRDICFHIGSLAKIHENVKTTQIRKRMIENWSQRTTMIRALDRVIQSMRDWQILSQNASTLDLKSPIIIKDSKLCLWFLEAAFRAEHLDSILFDKLMSLPTIFPFRLDVPLYTIKRAQNFEHHIQGINYEMISLKPK